jgi:hypothetical protein
MQTERQARIGAPAGQCSSFAAAQFRAEPARIKVKCVSGSAVPESLGLQVQPETARAPGG